MARVEELSVDEIRKRYVDSDSPISPQVLTRLQRDRRQGVQRLYVALRRRFERERDERLRMDAMRHFERLLWKSGIEDIAGVDEAGVAPLAGPVVAAAVMFPPDTAIAGVDDSKKLDPGTRATLAAEIRARASGVAVGIATVAEIDELNIYHASLLAMRRAVEGLPRPPQHVLVDARTVPGITMPQNAFNKGDGLNFSIAAASIIAKTARDAMMERLESGRDPAGASKSATAPKANWGTEVAAIDKIITEMVGSETASPTTSTPGATGTSGASSGKSSTAIDDATRSLQLALKAFLSPKRLASLIEFSE